MQAEAWNRADVDTFMVGYDKSEETTFSSSNGTLRGWTTVLERYRRRYPDQAAMGTLRFEKLEARPLADGVVLVLGHWKLQRAEDAPEGVFSLVMVRTPDGWKIILAKLNGSTIPLSRQTGASSSIELSGQRSATIELVCESTARSSNWLYREPLRRPRLSLNVLSSSQRLHVPPAFIPLRQLPKVRLAGKLIDRFNPRVWWRWMTPSLGHA